MVIYEMTAKSSWLWQAQGQKPRQTTFFQYLQGHWEFKTAVRGLQINFYTDSELFPNLLYEKLVKLSS